MSTYSQSLGNSFNLENLKKKMMPGMQSSEADFMSMLSSMGTNPTPQDLIQAQVKMQSFTLTANLSSNLIKELSDTLKSIVQKAA